jgi:hypothetical protein
MSKVITFSRQFPAYHPNAGQPTYFVEKLIHTFVDIDPETRNYKKKVSLDFLDSLCPTVIETKHHTIRSGSRFKVGEKFSPRCWSGKPYHSKQITFAPDIEIVKIWEIEIDIEGVFYINGKYIDVTSSNIPKNDGLSVDDFLEWFPVGEPFKGQIICWSNEVEY